VQPDDEVAETCSCESKMYIVYLTVCMYFHKILRKLAIIRSGIFCLIFYMTMKASLTICKEHMLRFCFIFSHYDEVKESLTTHRFLSYVKECTHKL